MPVGESSRVHGQKGKGGFLRAGQGWFVLSAKCQSVFGRLSHMISLNTQSLVVHLVGSWELTPPPINTHHHSPRSGGLAFLPPTERIWKGRQSFPFSSFTVRFLDQCNPQMAATRVQRFGCSLTTNLTTKQCNDSCWKETLRRTLHVQKRSGPSYVHTHTHWNSQATSQHPLKSPKSQIRPQSKRPWAPLSYSACANERCVLEQCKPLGRAELASCTDIHSSPLDKFGTYTSNCGPKLMLRANSLPPPSPHAIPLCNYMLRSHPNMQE